MNNIKMIRDIKKHTDDINEVNSQLEDNMQETNNLKNSKLDKNGIVTMANMGQDVKEAMTGGSVAVIGKNTVLTDNIVDKQVDTSKISDSIVKTITKVESVLGTSYTLYEKSNYATSNKVSTRNYSLRVMEEPITQNGELSVNILIPSEYVDQSNDSISVVVLRKTQENVFTIKKIKNMSVIGGINELHTNMYVEIGDYIGIHSNAMYKYTTEAYDSYHIATSSITEGSSLTLTKSNTFKFAWYYNINYDSIYIEDLKYIKHIGSEKTYTINKIDDFNIFTGNANDLNNRVRLRNTPSSSEGYLTLNMYAYKSGVINVAVFEFNGNEIAKLVNSNTFNCNMGYNEIETNMFIGKGQYVGIIGDTCLKFIATNSISSFTALPSSGVYNLTGVKYDLSYYYTVKSVNVINRSIDDINKKIESIDKTFNKQTHKKIGTIYSQKFIGSSLPTSNFGNWNLIGGIVDNGVKLASSSSFSNYLELNKEMHIDSDCVKWRIKLQDTTSRIRIRRLHATQGSIVEIDNGVLKIYNVAGTKVLAEKQIAFSLVLDREYNISVEVFAEVLTVKITDITTGETDFITYTSTGKGNDYAGRAWNNAIIYNVSGSFTVLQFDYFSKLPRNPELVILGDSIVEGDTIRNEVNGGYTKRWAGLLYEELCGNVAIVGKAGETSSGIVSNIDLLEKAFDKPTYVLLEHMTNDSVFETWKANTETLIDFVEQKGATPIICMMPMRSGRESFYNQVLDYVTNCPYKVIWFNRALTVNGDGKNIDNKYYLSDNLHPNVLGHLRMFNQVRADLEEIFL